ncbi:MAG TPA: SH3 domain-containing protein [Anaerolineales bacterium]|nr:SH3 domain-containing protein [Anaerolineales bacterium]
MFKTQNLYQNDERWKNVKLGNSSETIGSWGCLLTSITMMLNGLGYDETPETVNDKMRRAGGFDRALFIPSVVPFLWQGCVYRDMQSCESSSAPIAQIDAAIAAGKPVILQVDWNKQAGVQTHFVLVKEKRGNDYVIYDPYKYSGDAPDRDVLLTSRYKYNGARLETEISAVLWFDALASPSVEAPEVEKAPVPAEKYTLYAQEDNLALRAEPSLSGYLLKRLMKNTELISLETKSAAKAKLGANGRWMQVQDPNGDQGYAAAWYLADTRAGPTTTAVPSSTTNAPAASQLPTGALAFIPTEQIAFRTQPVVAPETVIRYIPVTEQLVSLEPAGEVIAKVGVTGQWLRVRDTTNKVGYVAAWYVRYASGSTAQAQSTGALPSTKVSSNGAPLKVRATAEGVALRKQPVVSESTLIKRLPLGTELIVLESNAEAKIGRNDQWLMVKDSTGTEGVVAAWFVAR